jgi:hypothetical protein
MMPMCKKNTDSIFSAQKVFAGGAPFGWVTTHVWSTKDGKTFKIWPSLPVATREPCLVIVNSSTLFMAGGWNSTWNTTSKSFLFTQSR